VQCKRVGDSPNDPLVDSILGLYQKMHILKWFFPQNKLLQSKLEVVRCNKCKFNKFKSQFLSAPSCLQEQT